MNQSTRSFTGDVRLSLSGLSDIDGVRLVDAAPDDEESVVFDLGSEGLESGQSVTRTIRIANPLNNELVFFNRLFATAAPNARPVISSTPPVTIGSGQTLVYDVSASDPDGPAPTVVLVDGPAGAVIEPGSSQLVFDTSAAASEESFRIRAIDSLGGFVEQVFVVDITGGNQRPVIVATEEVRLSEGERLEVPIAAFDPDDQPVTVSVSNLPPGAFYDAERSVLVWQTGAESAGRYRNVTISASDGISVATQTLEIVVSNQNQSPRLVEVVDRSVREGSTLSFTLLASDPDADALTYGARALPVGARLNPSNGEFSWTPRFDQHGLYELTLVATDGDLAAETTFTINVDNVNGPVELGEIPRRVVYEGQPLEIFVDAVDPDHPFAPPVVTPDGTFDIGNVAAPPLSFSFEGLPLDAEFNADAQLIRWTPSFEAAGRYEIDVTVSDDGDGNFAATTAQTQIVIDVLDQNAAPEVAEVPSQRVVAGATLVIPFTATDTDGNAITLRAGLADTIVGQLSPLPDFMSLLDNGDGTGSLTVTPGVSDRGDYAITIEADDDGNGNAANVQTGSFTFNVSVESRNAPPVLVDAPNVVAVVDQPFRFVVEADDLDQDGLTFEATGLPTGIELQESARYGEALISFTPLAGEVGVYPITVTVTDSGNGDLSEQRSDTIGFNLEIRASNQAPSLVPGSIPSVAEGSELVVNLVGSDPDSDDVSYVAAGLPAGATLDRLTGELRWTTGFEDSGEYEFQVTVSDGVASQTSLLAFEVTPTNRPPSVTNIPPVAGLESRELAVSFSAFDLDGDSLVVEADGLPEGAALVRGEDGLFTLRWPTEFGDAGSYDLTIRVTDPSGLVATAPLSIDLSKLNRAPEVVPTGSRQALVDQTLSIAVVASDLDQDALTYRVISLPAGAEFSDTGVFSWTPTSLDIGQYDVLLEVSDGVGTALESLEIQVVEAPILPDVRVEVTPSFPARPGQIVAVQPVGSGVAPIESVSVTVDGTPVPLDELGRGFVTPASPGRYEVVTTVVDVQGFENIRRSAILVRDAFDVAPPQVGIGLPAGTRIETTQTVELRVEDQNLDQWTLTLRNLRGGDSRIIASGSATGRLTDVATLDAALLSAGVYEIELSATDISGRKSTTATTVEVSPASQPDSFVYTAVEDLLDFGDIQVPLQLRYRSSDATIEQGLGAGWSWPLLNASPIAISSSSQSSSSPSAPTLRDGSILHLVAPDGSDLRFQFTPALLAGSGNSDIDVGAIFTPAWQAESGATWTLSTPSQPLQQVDGEFFHVSDGRSYEPLTLGSDGSAIQLQHTDGTTYHYASTGELTRVTKDSHHIDWSGFEAIADNGSRLSLRRDDQGRLATLSGLGASVVRLRYNESGQLASVRNDLTNQVFGYDSQARVARVLASSRDESFAVEYDSEGSVGQTKPIADFLGGLRSAFESSLSGTISANEQTRFAIATTEEELASGNRAAVLVGVEVFGSNGLDPLPPMATSASTSAAATELQQRDGFASALFGISTADEFVFEIDAEMSGDYQVNVFLAGDLDGDHDVDAGDVATLGGQIGLDVNDAGYIEGSDVNRDGIVDAMDVVLQARNFGFVADLPPVVSDATATTLPEVLTTIDLGELASDPEGTDLDYALESVTGGTATLLVDGKTVKFDPDGSGDSSFRFVATDRYGRSEIGEVTVQIDSREVTRLEIRSGEIAIGVGDAASVDVIALLADGTEYVLPPEEISFDVSDAIAVVTASGTVGGISDGSGLVTAHAFGLTAATSLQVGDDLEQNTFDIYPTRYALQTDQTRQFFVRERFEDGRVIDFADDPQTFYVVADPTVGQVSDDGLFTPIAAGITQVTVIREGVSLVSEIIVADPSVGQTVIDNTGGLVATDDGSIIIGAGPGTFADPSTVTVTPKDESDFVSGVPAGFQFSAGFELESSEAIASGGLSVEAIADASLSSGDPMFIFRESQTYNFETEAFETAWQLVDSMVVGDDGMARSTSPPNPSVNATGSFALVLGLTTGSLAGLAVGMTLDAGIQAARSGNVRIDVEPQSGRPFFFMPGQFLDAALPIPGPDYQITVTAFNPQFGFAETVFGAEYTPGGTREQLVQANTPETINASADVQSIAYNVEEIAEGVYAPVLTLTGSRFSSDIDRNEVLFFASNLLDDDQVEDSRQRPGILLSASASELKVIPPEGAAIGGGALRVDVIRDVLIGVPGGDQVVVPELIEGSPALIELESPYYSVVTNNASNSVSVVDVLFAADLSGTNRVSIADYDREVLGLSDDVARLRSSGESNDTTHVPVNLVNSIVAQIPVGRAPSDVAITRDGLRAYVANSGEGTISVIDLLTLQEVDHDATTAEIDRITPGLGTFNTQVFSPYYLALHPTLPYGVASDRNSGSIAWFRTDAPRKGEFFRIVDLDPEDSLLSRVGGDGPIRSLTDLEFSEDGRYLVINTTGSSSWAGADLQSTVGGAIVVDFGQDFELDFQLDNRPRFETESVNIVPLGYKPFGLKRLDNGLFAVAVRGAESVSYIDPAKASRPSFVATNLRLNEGTLPDEVSTSGGLQAVFRFINKNLFSIDSPEDLTIAPPLAVPVAVGDSGLVIRQLGFVLMNATYNGPEAIASSPEFGGGGNIGILANPLSDNPQFIGATQKIPYSFPDQIDFGPDNDTIIASFKGINQVLLYDYSVL
ncbi:MAG: putative Ig domain-containing protein, partial [Planctomycetota bacterium]